MNCQEDIENLKRNWKALIEKLESDFGVDPDLQGILFLIGVQELGKGSGKFSKDEKQDLMHIATCRLLSKKGYYETSGRDTDGWPRWKLVSKPPAMSLKDQDVLLKSLAVEYFLDSGLLTIQE